MQGSIRKDDVLQLMGELNINAPIKATIIFSDSDDDIVSSQLKPFEEKLEIDSTHHFQNVLDMPSLDEQSIDPKKLDHFSTVMSKNKTIINETENNKNKRPVKRKLSIKRVENHNKTKSIIDLKNKGNQENDGINEEQFESPPKRQSFGNIINTHNLTCAPQDQFNKERMETSNVVTNECESLRTLYSTIIEQNDKNTFATALSDKSSQVFQNHNPSPELRKNSLIPANSSAPPEISPSTNTEPRCLNRPDPINFLQSMLNSISIHIVLILKAQDFYKKKIIEDKKHRSLYNENFKRYKYYIYDLSYSAVLTMILPNLNDEAFVKKFIHNTILLAQTKSMLCNEDQIRPLVSEMIYSAKNTKQRIMTYFQECQNPLLQQMLTSKSTNNNNLEENESQTFSSVSGNAHQGNVEQPQCPNVTIGTAAMENVLRDQISVTTLRKNLQQLHKVNKQKSGQIQNEPNANILPNHSVIVRPPCPTYNFVDNRNSNMQPSVTRDSLNQTLPAKTPNYPMNASGNINNPTKNYFNNSLTQTINNLGPTNQREAYTHNTTPINSISTQPVNPYPVNGQNNIHGVQKPLANFGNSFGTLINQATPTGQNDLQYNQRSNTQLHLSQSKPPWAGENSLYRNQYRNQNENLALHIPDEAYRSSISRDSGFYSPPTLDKNNDQLQQDRLQQTPLITHVTSLNPNVVNIVQGPCHVCGKITNQKCVACYLKYYCSYECQSSDWTHHMQICKI